MIYLWFYKREYINSIFYFKGEQKELETKCI